MTRKEVEKMIKDYFKKYNETVEETNTYKKVENMLKQYNRFKKRIIYLENNMENIILKKSSTISGLGGFGFEYKSDLEKKEEIIDQNKKLLGKYKIIIELVDEGLLEIKDDEYFQIIELRYFKKDTIENISEILKVSTATIKRNRNRLINELCEIIFPEEILEKIF